MYMFMILMRIYHWTSTYQFRMLLILESECHEGRAPMRMENCTQEHASLSYGLYILMVYT